MPWGLIAYALGALAVAGVLYAAWGQFTDWIKAPVVAELQEARGALKSCSGSLERQNGAVKALQEAAKARTDASERAAADARKAAEANYRAAQAMQQSGPLDPDVCVSARLRAKGYVEGRK